MKLCWFGCGILAALLALSLLCGMLTQRSTRDAAAALEQALEALDRDETAQAVEPGPAFSRRRQLWRGAGRGSCHRLHPLSGGGNHTGGICAKL